MNNPFNTGMIYYYKYNYMFIYYFVHKVQELAKSNLQVCFPILKYFLMLDHYE